MDSKFPDIRLVKQPESGVRSRYAGDRGICLEHEEPTPDCTPCNDKKQRKADEVKKRKENGLYKFEVRSDIPMLMAAFATNSDNNSEHHAYYANGSGVLDRSGTILGVVKANTNHCCVIEHENHEILVVKQVGAAKAFEFRDRVLKRLMSLLDGEFDSNPAFQEMFGKLENMVFPDAHQTPPPSLRLRFLFVPLVNFARVVDIVSDRVDYLRRPGGGKSDTGRSRRNSSASSIAYDQAPSASWRFPSKLEDLLDCINDARAQYYGARPIPRAPQENFPLRNLLRERVSQRVANSNTRGSHMSIVLSTDTLDLLQREARSCGAANVVLPLCMDSFSEEPLEAEWDDETEASRLDEFDAFAEASSLFTPQLENMADLGSLVDTAMLESKPSPQETLNSMMQVNEPPEEDSLYQINPDLAMLLDYIPNVAVNENVKEELKAFAKNNGFMNIDMDTNDDFAEFPTTQRQSPSELVSGESDSLLEVSPFE